jgi:hypothetical protein
MLDGNGETPVDIVLVGVLSNARVGYNRHPGGAQQSLCAPSVASGGNAGVGDKQHSGGIEFPRQLPEA